MRGKKKIDVLGNEMYVDTKGIDGVSRILRNEGVFERETTRLFHRIIKRGMRVLDIGAHIGYYTLIFAKKVGREGKVFGFEADLSNFDLLRKNVKLNGYTNVILEQAAVLDYDGLTELFLDPSDNACHTVFPVKDGGSLKVKAIKLDSYFSNHDGYLDLVKMDIEGAEPLAIDGMSGLIKRDNPNIVLEFNISWLREVGFEPREVLDLLTGKGYELYAIGESGEYSEPDGIDGILEATRRRGKINVFCK